MSYEEIPIQSFVILRYQTSAVQKIVEQWRVEPQLVVEKVVEHFKEMGIYKVPYNQERMLTKHLLQLLRNSPEIMKLVARARNEELKRQRNRHAD